MLEQQLNTAIKITLIQCLNDVGKIVSDQNASIQLLILYIQSVNETIIANHMASVMKLCKDEITGEDRSMGTAGIIIDRIFTQIVKTNQYDTIKHMITDKLPEFTDETLKVLWEWFSAINQLCEMLEAIA